MHLTKEGKGRKQIFSSIHIATISLRAYNLGKLETTLHVAGSGVGGFREGGWALEALWKVLIANLRDAEAISYNATHSRVGTYDTYILIQEYREPLRNVIRVGYFDSMPSEMKTCLWMDRLELEKLRKILPAAALICVCVCIQVTYAARTVLVMWIVIILLLSCAIYGKEFFKREI